MRLLLVVLLAAYIKDQLGKISNDGRFFSLQLLVQLALTGMFKNKVDRAGKKNVDKLVLIFSSTNSDRARWHCRKFTESWTGSVSPI